MAAKKRLKGRPAGLIVRLAAALYDGFLLFSLAFLAFVPVTQFEHAGAQAPSWLKSMLLLAIAYAYFVGFWTKTGATTGMKAWRLRLAMADSGAAIDLVTANLRFLAMLLTVATLGLPMISILCTKKRQAFHDVLAGTVVCRVMQ